MIVTIMIVTTDAWGWRRQIGCWNALIATSGGQGKYQEGDEAKQVSGAHEILAPGY